MINQHMFDLRLWCRKRKFTHEFGAWSWVLPSLCALPLQKNSIFPDKTTTEFPTDMYSLLMGP
jgi:hypothetical protein